MNRKIARIVTGMSIFAILARTIALVSRSLAFRAGPGQVFAPAIAPAAGEVLTPAPIGDSPVAPARIPPAPLKHSGAQPLVAASLLALELVAVLAAVVAPAPVRGLLILVAAVALPGAAITLRMRLGDALTMVALTAAVGLAIDIFVGLAMVWTGWWHPAVAAVIVGGASTISLLPELRGFAHVARLRVADPLPALFTILPAGVALGLWVLSLRRNVDLIHLRNIGLPAGLPVTWYVALAVALLGGVVMIASHRPRGLVIAVYVGVVVLIMYGTLPALAHVAPYSWTYKHIGVTSLLEQTGTVHPGVDIYNRWPGFFAAAAAFAKLAGLAPLSFAAWFEPLFVALDALLVAALARAVSGRARVAGWAALLFTVSNFVGQDYYSPQAMTYVLCLATLVLVVRQLTDPDALHRWGRAAIARVSPGTPAASETRALPITPATSIALVIVLQVAIVATHQLTPYILVGQVGALTVIGVTRPRWLVAVLGLLALGYLLPNITFVREHFGLFTGFNPVGNANVATISGGQPWAVINGGGTISKLLSVMAFIAAVRLVRLGHGRMVAVIVTLAVVPFVILFAQSYGGEASLRVFLFSAPWRVVLVAWGLATIGGGWRSLLAGAVPVAALTVLTLPTFLGRAPLVVVSPSEVTAAHVFYAHAPAGSVLTLAAPNFPTRLQPRYAAMADPGEDVNLMLYPRLRSHFLGAADIPSVVNFMHLYSHSDFLVFAAAETRYAVATHLALRGSLESLQRAVGESSRFRLWYHASDVSIYQLVGP
jgi:hypothetical protein